MADTTIHALADLGALNASDEFELDRDLGGGSRVSGRGALSALKTLINAGRTFEADIGDGSSASFTLTHGLGTRSVHVTVFRNSTPWDDVLCDVGRPSTTQVTLSGFGAAPSVDQFHVVVSL